MSHYPIRPAPKQNPLTLIMKIKSPEDFAALRDLLNRFLTLPRDKNPIDVALDKLAKVHFARFVFMDDDTKLAVITSYDDSFEDYINDFIDAIGDIFNALLAHMAEAPPLPVQKNRAGVSGVCAEKRSPVPRHVLQRLPDFGSENDSRSSG